VAKYFSVFRDSALVCVGIGGGEGAFGHQSFETTDIQLVLYFFSIKILAEKVTLIISGYFLSQHCSS
jgi:hypothetical protein